MQTRAYLVIAAILGLTLTILSIMLYSEDNLNGYMPESEYVHSELPNKIEP